MPKGLYVDRPQHVVLREYDEAPLAGGQYRIRAELGTIKHGTGFHVLSGQSPFADKRFDMDLRLFVPLSPERRGREAAEQFVGNMVVGRVVEVGAGVKRFRLGDRVYCHGPLCETLTLAEADGEPLGGLDAADAVCLDPALYACGVIRDGRVGLGDEVVLFGLGAIGQMAVQLLRLAGCRRVVAVDPVEKRRLLAATFGADLLLDPSREDVAMRVREYLGHGADVAVEASGHYAALRQAIRAVRQCGRVATCGYYKGADSGLELGADFFHNRLELIASLPAWGNPLRDAPLWDYRRAWRTLAEWFAAGRPTSRGVLQPVVPLEDSPEAFLRAWRDPSYAIKLGVAFGPAGGGQEPEPPAAAARKDG